MATKAEAQQISLLQSINRQMAENKAAIIGLGKQMGKKETSAEEAKRRLKKTPGAGTAAGKKESLGTMAKQAKTSGGDLLKALGLGALGASLGLAFQDEIIGSFKKGFTDLFGGKDSLLGGAINSIVGLLDELQNPLGALSTGLATGLNRFTKWVDTTVKKPILTPTPTPTPTPDADKNRGQGNRTTGTQPAPEPEKPVARTARQTQIENTDRARNLTKAQQAELEKKGFKVDKDGAVTKTDGKVAKAADVKQALDDVKAKGPSAAAIKAADDAAPKAQASRARVVGQGATPLATNQAAVNNAVATAEKPAAAASSKPGGSAGSAAAPQAAAPSPPPTQAAPAIKPTAAAKPQPNAFIKVAKKIGAALKGIYDTVSKFIASASKYSGIKWVAKLGGKALGPIAALITLFMLGKNELDPSISDEERMKNRFVLLGEAAGGVLGGVVGALVLSIIPGLGTLIGGVLGGIIGAFVGGNLGLFIYKCCRDGVKETIMATFKSAKEIAAKALAYLKEKGIKGLSEDAGELIGKGADYVAGLASSAATAVSDAAGAAYDAAAESASQVKDFAAAKLSAAGDAIKDSAVGRGVSSAADAVSEKASKIGSSIKGFFGFGSKDDKVEKPGMKGKQDESYWEGGLGSPGPETKPPGTAAGAMAPGGSDTQTKGSQTINNAAQQAAMMDMFGSGGRTESALAAIVQNSTEQTKAIIAALAKIDAKASSGGNSGMPVIVPVGGGSSGGLGRKTVIGAPGYL